MFRALKQFVVLIIFLSLTVFSSFYFQEDRNHQSLLEERETSIWLVNAVKGIASFVSSMSKLSLSTNSVLDFQGNEQSTDWQEISSYEFNNSELEIGSRALVRNLNQKMNQSEFRQFFNDFFKNIPTLYLNAKIYSNAWRNIRSLDWLIER